MDISKTTLVQFAAVIGALSTIIGASVAVDSRYVKRSELDTVKNELKISINRLHVEVLENEDMRQKLKDNAAALAVLEERNRRKLAEIESILAYQTRERAMVRAPAPVTKVVVPEPISRDPELLEEPTPNN